MPKGFVGALAAGKRDVWVLGAAGAVATGSTCRAAEPSCVCSL
jgi:hypothetical protein